MLNSQHLFYISPFTKYIGNKNSLKIKEQHRGENVYNSIIPHNCNHCSILASAYLFNTLQFKCKSNVYGCLFEPHELARVAVMGGSSMAWRGPLALLWTT